MSAFTLPLLHLLMLFLPALLSAALAAALAKAIWRRALAGMAWRHLFGPVALAQSLVSLTGLIVMGRDGRMLTYGLMVVSGAFALAWAGFGPGRTRRAA